MLFQAGVCSPRQYGGLGIHNLNMHGNALRIRWLWQRWMDESKPWFGLPVPVDAQAREIFNSSVTFEVGDGGLTSFWHDPWLLHLPLKDALGELFVNCTMRNLSIKEALL